jgi:hypothetical protein
MAAQKKPASLRPRCTRGGSPVAAMPIYHLPTQWVLVAILSKVKWGCEAFGICTADLGTESQNVTSVGMSRPVIKWLECSFVSHETVALVGLIRLIIN